MIQRALTTSAFLAVILTAGLASGAQPASGEWRYWGADERSSRYSPLDQINAENAGTLEVAWRWSALNYGP